MHQHVNIVRDTKAGKPSKGSAGLCSQCMGLATTVSAVADATGGIGTGNIITTSKR